jgi:hypothetical protein
VAKSPRTPSGSRKPPTNSGIFSHGTKAGKQKLDTTPKTTKATSKAKAESMSRKGRKGPYSGPSVL